MDKLVLLIWKGYAMSTNASPGSRTIRLVQSATDVKKCFHGTIWNHNPFHGENNAANTATPTQSTHKTKTMLQTQ